jgi:hypothetical protein
MTRRLSEQMHPWSDAWLLLAVGCRLGAEPVSLPELIATADGIQHAVPTFDEVDGALARLTAAGLVTVHERAIRLTAAGKDLLSRTSADRKPIWRWQEALQRELPAAPWSPEYDPATARRDPTLPAVIKREEYDKAVQAYSR